MQLLIFVIVMVEYSFNDGNLIDDIKVRVMIEVMKIYESNLIKEDPKDFLMKTMQAVLKK